MPAIAENSQPENSVIRDTLEEILKSKHFHTSKQCSDLLRYIVEHSLISGDASLKERVIGIQVFSRAPDYDTAEDPVVRVRAADVRKRLAQFYQGIEPGSVPLHIELQPGAYRVSFRQEAVAAPAPQLVPIAPASVPQIIALDDRADARRSSKLKLWWWIGAAAIAVVAATIALWRVIPPASEQSLFFAPLTRTEPPVLLYLGANAAFVFNPTYLAQYRAAHGNAYTGPEFFVDLPPNGTIRTSDLIPVPNTFITGGDLAAAVQMVSLLDGFKKPYVLRTGADVVVGDLRGRPGLLVGGFNNHWTIEATKDLRFFFNEGTRIEDRIQPGKGWAINIESGVTSEDYALISRLVKSKTGGPMVIVAGIGSFGTQAAAEFLSSPEHMRDLLKTAPRDWQTKNMQAVLHIKVVDYVPVGVDVVATTYW